MDQSKLYLHANHVIIEELLRQEILYNHQYVDITRDLGVLLYTNPWIEDVDSFIYKYAGKDLNKRVFNEMKECIEDAQKIVKEKNLKSFQNDMINIAISLFEKRASHVVYWKENLCKEKFDEKNEKKSN